MERIGPVAYKLELPPNSQLHPEFHVSLLKKCVGQGVAVQTNLPAVASDGSINPVPEPILDYRWVKRGKKIVHEALIRWANLPLEDATWEDPLRIKQVFPEFDLEDKVILEGGRNDTNPA